LFYYSLFQKNGWFVDTDNLKQQSKGYVSCVRSEKASEKTSELHAKIIGKLFDNDDPISPECMNFESFSVLEPKFGPTRVPIALLFTTYTKNRVIFYFITFISTMSEKYISFNVLGLDHGFSNYDGLTCSVSSVNNTLFSMTHEDLQSQFKEKLGQTVQKDNEEGVYTFKDHIKEHLPTEFLVLFEKAKSHVFKLDI
jgi:hypothetical protein